MLDHDTDESTVSFGLRGTASLRTRAFYRAGCVVAAALLLSAPSVFAADTAPTQARDASDSVSFVCLSNPVKSGGERRFVIGVAPEKVEEFLARGFVRTSCAGTKRVDGDEKRGICEVAQARDPLVNLHFWQRFSLTPEEMCQMVGVSSRVARDAP